MRELLRGKKTYILAVGVALVVFATSVGWIDPATGNTILGILGAGGLATLRAGIEKNK